MPVAMGERQTKSVHKDGLRMGGYGDYENLFCDIRDGSRDGFQPACVKFRPKA